MDIKNFSFLKECNCGKKHPVIETEIIAEKNAAEKIPDIIKRLGGSRAFLLADKNTYRAAGKCGFIRSLQK